MKDQRRIYFQKLSCGIQQWHSSTLTWCSSTNVCYGCRKPVSDNFYHCGNAWCSLDCLHNGSTRVNLTHPKFNVVKLSKLVSLAMTESVFRATLPCGNEVEVPFEALSVSFWREWMQNCDDTPSAIYSIGDIWKYTILPMLPKYSQQALACVNKEFNRLLQSKINTIS